MDKFTPIPLDNYCNASSTEPYPTVGRKPHIDAWTVEHIPQLSIVETRGKMVPYIGVNAQALWMNKTR